MKLTLKLDLKEEVRLKTLNRLLTRSIAFPDTIMKYAAELLHLSDNDLFYKASAYFYIGQALKDKGNYEQSVEYLFKSLKIKSEIADNTRPTESLIATVYGRIGDIRKCSYYFHGLFNRDDSRQYPKLLIGEYNNFAEAFYQNEMYDSAYYYFARALFLAKKEGTKAYVKFISGNLGMVNLKLGRLDSAEVQLKEVLDYLAPSTDASITFQTLLAEVYLRKGRLSDAIILTEDVIDQAELGDFKEQLRDGYLLLSELHEALGNFQESLDAYRQYVVVDNSIKDVETVRRIGDLRTEYEVGQKQIELDLVTAEKRNQELITIGVSCFALIFVVLALIIFRFYQSKAKINAELERLNQTKDKFFSIISHDLRGPVSSFLGISRMIKYLVASKETDQLLEVADDIDESVDRLSALLDNLLSWAMQQQGHFPNVPEKVSLNDIASDLTKTLDTMAKGKQISLTAHLEDRFELWVDKNTTMTILRNLVNNALKFTPEGGKVTITAEKHLGYAHIHVTDNGVGIPEEKLKKLFKLQEKKSTYGTSGEKGLGLGLQLVYEFVEMNGGGISVDSQEGEGTTFTVNLPLYEMDESPVMA